MIDEEQPILEAHTNVAVEELKSTVEYHHLDRKTKDNDEIEMTSSMAASSDSRRYDVFPSFRGEDVRDSFLSHLLKELKRKSITFIDDEIERSRLIGPELLSAIRGSRIAIVVFSKNYASSTWCLNELVEIHKCFMNLNQMVIPIFFHVDPSEVKKQTGGFGKVFEETCKGKSEDEKQSWKQALADVATMAGEDLRNWPNEAAMIEKVAQDVLKKTMTPSDDFGDFVGIEAHLEALKKLMCLESEEARMVGIVGTSGIGKSTIGRAQYNQLSSQFHLRAFETCRRTNGDDYEQKLYWEKQILSKMLDEKDLKIEKVGAVKERLNEKKVLIILDDVNDLEFLKTLVGKTEWFGPGSIIIVITQDRQLLKAHDINLIYEVDFPSEDLALTMLCQSAFGKDSPPDDFRELALKVAKLAGNLPLGLSVLGSSLRRREKDEWMDLLLELQNGLNGDIMKTLRVSYDRLHEKDQDMFLYIACFFNGFEVSDVKDLLKDNARLTTLANKSLIRITPEGYIEMHNLLEKLGIEIDRAKSNGNLGKRRFLTDFEDIEEVLTEKTGTETVLGIRLSTDYRENRLLSIDEKAFEGMHNLQYLSVRYEYDITLPRGFVSLPHKLRLLEWDYFPLQCLPSTFKAKYLVELKMMESKLEKLWEGTQPLGSLKKMNLSHSEYLKEIPDLSNAINLEEVDLSECESLVTLPSSIQNAIKLRKLDMRGCTKLESFPTHLNLESLEYLNLTGCESLVTLPSSIQNAIKLRELHMSGCTKLESFPTDLNLESLEYLDLTDCDNLRNFPAIKMGNSNFSPDSRIEIRVKDCLWNKNLPGLDYLDCLRRCMPCKFSPEYFVSLDVRGNKLEKLWEGVQSLASLVRMDLSECENLTEIPDLSKATNLKRLKLNNCKSLVTVPSTIGNLQKLVRLEMQECTGLEVLPTDVNLSSLDILDLSGCSSLRSFPLISWNIGRLYLENTAIVEVPCCIENFSRLTVLMMYCCQSLKNTSPNIFRLTSLMLVDFTDCRGVIMALSDATVVATMEDHISCVPLYENIEYTRERFWDEDDDYFKVNWYLKNREYCSFRNCFKLDRDARELILRSCFKPVVLPGGEVPKYFQHRTYGDSLTVTLPQSSLSQYFLRFKACVVVDHLSEGKGWYSSLDVNVGFKGAQYQKSFFEEAELKFFETDHLFFCSFQFDPKDLPSKLTINDVEFKFCCSNRIKECGVQLWNVYPSPDGSDGSSETEYNHPTRRSKKRMRMTSGTSEEYINLAGDQIVADTRLAALNLELLLGQGEASSVKYMITEEQIPILDPVSGNRITSCHHDDEELSENLFPFYSLTPGPEENVCNFFFI